MRAGLICLDVPGGISPAMIDNPRGKFRDLQIVASGGVGVRVTSHRLLLVAGALAPALRLAIMRAAAWR